MTSPIAMGISVALSRHSALIPQNNKPKPFHSAARPTPSNPSIRIALPSAPPASHSALTLSLASLTSSSPSAHTAIPNTSPKYLLHTAKLTAHAAAISPS
eukprot:CAMPEP_0174886956 /NCGR_PEP_ID=MMETSP0167-20121228/2184_1 /TAXON_ID=38298 /ORGANISM="Rhodella maculata, Strain CCMP736" /LENGTH=99 /DNA_ID=CAMNT_0016123199 /DNA_START=1206 /DNA_END=1503 /DNA_ORIENTATION=-